MRRPLIATLTAITATLTLAFGLAGCASTPKAAAPKGPPVISVTSQYSPPIHAQTHTHRARSARTAADHRAGARARAKAKAKAATEPVSAAQLRPDAIVSGLLKAPGGPYLRDRYGRVVLLHGVNAVYKLPPYELTVTPGQANSFTAADAGRIARLGFNIVRLGMTWQGLEPGHGGPNNPAICTPGTPAPPTDAGMYDAAVTRQYLDQLARVVSLLGRDHVYTLLDMHQDIESSVFGGEGAPPWAVCTNGIAFHRPSGRWSKAYANGALNVAADNFWTNDVVGNLQGQFDMVWSVVARYFARDQWVMGFDPYNEPFERELTMSDADAFATQLQCFYAGQSHPGSLAHFYDQIVCPPGDPETGVIPDLEKAAPHHLIFIEPDIYSIHRQPNLLGSMNFPDLVLNFHVYCSARSPVTGDPTNLGACETKLMRSMLRRQSELAGMASARQPGGPAWFMSEFGATQSTDMIDWTTEESDLLYLGWTEWAWKYYNDPTGSSHEALVAADGALEPTAGVLLRTYPQALAGMPTENSYDPTDGEFSVQYTPNHHVKAPTIVFVARSHYPRGWCATVQGGRIVSAPSSTHLLVQNDRHGRNVEIEVNSGRCRPPSQVGSDAQGLRLKPR